MQGDTDEGFAHRVEICRAENGHNASDGTGLAGIDGNQSGVGKRAAHGNGVEHARKDDIVDIAPPPCNQALQFEAGNTCSDS